MIKFLTSGLVNLYGPAGEGGEAGGGDGGGGDAGAEGGQGGQGGDAGDHDTAIYPNGPEKKAGEGEDGDDGDKGEVDDGLTDAERELMEEDKPKVGPDGKPIVEKKETPAPGGALKLDKESVDQLASALRPKETTSGGATTMSQEEITKALNPVVVTPDTLKSLGFTEPNDEQVKGFQTFANSIVKNAASIARILIQQEAAKFEQILTPITGHIQSQQAEGAKTEFYTSFPSLKNYENIVKVAAAEVQATRPDGSQKTRQEIYKEVAARTFKTLRSLNVQIGKPAANANHNAGSEKVVGAPNKFPGPGRSGGSGPTGGKANPDADIYAR